MVQLVQSYSSPVPLCGGVLCPMKGMRGTRRGTLDYLLLPGSHPDNTDQGTSPKVTEPRREGRKAQPGVEPGSLTNRVSVLTTTLLNLAGPHRSVSLR